MLRKLLVVIAAPWSSLLRFTMDIMFGAHPIEGGEAPNRLEHALDSVDSQPEPDPVTKLVPDAPWVQELWVLHRGEIIRVPTKEIDLIRAERDYMRLHVGSNSFLLHRTICELERHLDPAGFIRLHRSTIVRADFIVGFRCSANGSWSAHLRDGRWLRVGRTRLANVLALTRR